MFFDQPLKIKHQQLALLAISHMAPDVKFETVADYFPRDHYDGLKGGFRGFSIKMNPSKADTSVCLMWIQLCQHSQQVAQAQLIISHVPQGSQRS